MSRTLVILGDNQEEMERIDGTFLALFPSPSGIRVVAEGDLRPAARQLKPILDMLISMIMKMPKGPFEFK